MTQLLDATTMADHAIRTALRADISATSGGAWVDMAVAMAVRGWAKELGIRPETINGADGKPQYLVMTGATWLLVVTADKRVWAQVGTDRPEWLA